MKRPHRMSSAGLTLVEILVCMAVAAVVITSLNVVVTSFLHVSQRGRYLNLANSYVEGKVESIRNAGFNSLGNGTTSLTSEMPSQLPPGKTGSMTISSPSSDLKQIDITVSYKDQGQTNTYNYTTYMGELGVGQ